VKAKVLFSAETDYFGQTGKWKHREERKLIYGWKWNWGIPVQFSAKTKM